MNIRSYVIVLAGILTNLVVLDIIIEPILVTRPIPWYPVPQTATVVPAIRGEWTLLPTDTRGGCLPRAFLGAYEFWRPDSAQLAQLEDDLARVLSKIDSTLWSHREDLREPVPPLLSYRRQYVGLLRLGEVPVIFVNAAIPNDRQDQPNSYWGGWRRDMICVDDGGTGYWHLEYDPARRRFRGFAFNGSG